MSDYVPFHLTRGGRQFYERDFPEMARALAALSATMVRIADALERRDAAGTTPAPPVINGTDEVTT